MARALKALPKRLSRKVQNDALREAAEPMRAEMSRLAPRRPPKPDLRDHIVISLAKGEDSKEAAVAVGPARPNYFYGSFQEFGTKHHAAQPFMRPGFDAMVRESLQILGAAVWRELAARGVSRSVVDESPIQSGPDGGGLL